jgi:hypothetical protein
MGIEEETKVQPQKIPLVEAMEGRLIRYSPTFSFFSFYLSFRWK